MNIKKTAVHITAWHRTFHSFESARVSVYIRLKMMMMVMVHIPVVLVLTVSIRRRRCRHATLRSCGYRWRHRMLMLRRTCAVTVSVFGCFRVRHNRRNSEGVSSDRQRVLHRAGSDQIARPRHLPPVCCVYDVTIRWWAEKSKQRRQISNCSTYYASMLTPYGQFRSDATLYRTYHQRASAAAAATA